MTEQMQCSKSRACPIAGTQSSLGWLNEGTRCVAVDTEPGIRSSLFVAADTWVPPLLILVGLFCRADSVGSSSLVGW